MTKNSVRYYQGHLFFWIVTQNNSREEFYIMVIRDGNSCLIIKCHSSPVGPIHILHKVGPLTVLRNEETRREQINCHY